LCENCQWQSCKAFIGLTIRPKMIGGGRLVLEILDQSDSRNVTSSKKVQLTLISPLRAFQ